MSFWIINNTTSCFTAEDHGLNWGKWPLPPKNIQPNSLKTLAFRSCGHAHTVTGTEGWVRYASDQKRATFIIRWEVPYLRSGYLTVHCEGEGCGSYVFEVTHYDPTVDDPNPTLTITSV